MTAWLDPLRAALDGLDAPVAWFVRDDDAGWGDEALHALLEVTDAHEVPVDLAVIPAATSHRLAAGLRRRAASGRSRLHWHQHGWEHVSHQVEGRKCEFGDARRAGQQRADLDRGRARFAELFEEVPVIFTPPWNRCTGQTAHLLHELGFTALSRDLSAGTAGVPGLAELPVTVDWFAKVRQVPATREQLGQLLAGAVGRAAGEGTPVGLMLHHAVTDAGERAALDALLGVVAAHPHVRLTPMAQALATAA